MNVPLPPPPPPSGPPPFDFSNGVPPPPGPPPNISNAAPPPPGPPPNLNVPPSPPGPPPDFINANVPPPPNAFADIPGAHANHIAPQSNFTAPPPPGYPPNYNPPTTTTASQNFNNAGSGHFPPPPQPNFPQQPDAYYHTIPAHATMLGSVSGRPLPPVPSYDDQSLEPVSPPISAMSVSSSHSSLMSTSSHQSTESSRSLSPPVGSSRSPGTTRAYLGSVLEEDPASNLQQALVNKLRLRSKSMDAKNAASTGAGCRRENEHSPPRGMAGSKGVAPPVAHKPPRAPSIPQKPSRSSSLASIGLSAPVNGAQPHLPHQSHSFSSMTLPYPRSSRPAHIPDPPHRQLSLHESDSEPEDDSALAVALRQKKLRKTPQVNDKSAPVLR